MKPEAGQFHRLSNRLLWPALATFVALKLAILLFAPPLGDEAYYWMWGQQLDWSYHDHPPLNALLLRLSNELFGWNHFALRAPAIATFIVSASIIVWWGRRLAPTNVADPGTAALTLFLASPLMLSFTTWVYPDHLLIACLLVAGHFFVLYADSAERGERRAPYLIAAAFALGLAALSKYSAVFVGIGFLSWFIFTRPGRRELLTPYPWLAGMMAVAMQAPVIWWNLQHNLSSFEYHFSGRFNPNWSTFDIPLRFSLFLLLGSVIFSPALLPGMWRFLAGRHNGDIGRYRSIALPTFVTAILVFATMSVTALFYWIIPAVVLFYPVAIAFVAGRLHLVIPAGLVLAALVTFHATVVPISALFGATSVDHLPYGWNDIVRWVEREGEHRDADLLLTSQYNLAALLGFKLGRTDVYSYSARGEQYDYWFDPSRYRGQTALILTNSHNPLYVEQRQLFEKVEQIGTLTTYGLGLPLDTFTLYFGTGLKPPATATTTP
ncbi:MAG: glycosyltransferase family 39 protein [Rhizobiaceae bacterium]